MDGSMFNEHQQEWMKTLSETPPERRCFCGWDFLGQCYHCNRDNPGQTRADAIAKMEICPECGNDVANGRSHIVTCSRRKAPEEVGGAS